MLLQQQTPTLNRFSRGSCCSKRPLNRICDCFSQLYAKNITPTDKQELDEALLQEEMELWSPRSEIEKLETSKQKP
ncbi:phosphoenolpyruvate carboxylase 1-like [Raphanus sativus]|uniref:Phosphoenolpyruvate carboxylase 1-like n=1 Tax=Raphanus sativus TaxID=3726 RepID=A0A9W3BXJ0_RAPSA|nr:phosphoenolpyruvate carboxylase 1-like [Raphanus sativus]XP_056855433.1 phosphoenolpyruvate carboxylase 1-like [Raphanus sativus]